MHHITVLGRKVGSALFAFAFVFSSLFSPFTPLIPEWASDFYKAIDGVKEATAQTTGTVSVNASQTFQSIDGIGAAIVGSAQWLRNMQEPHRTRMLDAIFSQKNGIGLSMLRAEIIGENHDVLEPGNWSARLEPTLHSHQTSPGGAYDFTRDQAQVWLMKTAQEKYPENKTKYFATVWTAPPWMKSNNCYRGDNTNSDWYDPNYRCNGQPSTVKSSSYQDFANYLAEYVLGYKRVHGIEFTAISFANEPDFPAYYQGGIWSDTQMRDFMANFLKPTWDSKGLTGKTLIAAPEETGWFDVDGNRRLDTILANSNASSILGVIAQHGYRSNIDNPAIPTKYNTAVASGKRVWQTEDAYLGTSENIAMAGDRGGIAWARKLNGMLTKANTSAWIFWYLASRKNDGGAGNLMFLGYGTPAGGDDLTTYRMGKKFWTIGNFSRFVRPGYVRIGATESPASGVLTSAYKDPAGSQVVIVAINTNGTSANIGFNISGATVNSLTPYVTSEVKNIEPGNAFSPNVGFTLEPNSVTTFVSNPSPLPTVPTNSSVFLSDIDWVSAGHRDMTPPQVNRTNPGTNSIPQGFSIDGYTKGIGVESPARVTYNVGGQYNTFKATIKRTNGTSANYQLWADDALVKDFGTVSTDSDLRVEADITGKRLITLVSNPIGSNWASAVWAGARVERVSGTNPVVNLSSNVSSITSGDSVQLNWSVSNATSCSASASPSDTAWSGSKSNTSGSQTLTNVTQTKTYTLTCSNSSGNSSSQVVVNVSAPVVTANISVSPAVITSGQSSTITWSSSGATSCTASGGWSGSKAVSGTQVVNPTSNTTYSIACTNASGGTSGTQSTSVTVNSATANPTVTFTSSATNVNALGTVTLNWTSANTTSCTASNGWSGTKAITGSESISNMTATRTFGLSCLGSNGTTVTANPITVTVGSGTTGSVSITSPTNGQTFNVGTPIDISATVTLPTASIKSQGVFAFLWSELVGAFVDTGKAIASIFGGGKSDSVATKNNSSERNVASLIENTKQGAQVVSITTPSAGKFRLSADATTSAGVYKKSDGTLVRTLWSNQRKTANTDHAISWDGKSDDGVALSPVSDYEARVIAHNVNYEWEGVVGNSVKVMDGKNFHRAFDKVSDISAAGNTVAYAVEYNEMQYAAFAFESSAAQDARALIESDYKGQYTYVASDGANAYFADLGSGFDSGRNHIRVVSLAPSAGIQKSDTGSPRWQVNGGDITALAVQRNGSRIFVGRKNSTVSIQNKTNGSELGTINTGAVAMATDSAGNVWIANGNTVKKYSESGSELMTLSGITGPAYGVAVNSVGNVLVADGGTHQLRFFNGTTGQLIQTYGQSGGYPNLGPKVAFDKFWFYRKVPLTFVSDDSFWVGDTKNNRLVHYSSTFQPIPSDTIMYIPHLYMSTVDVNDATRVFAAYQEFKIDYSVNTQNNSGWTLVNNWEAGLTDANLLSSPLTAGAQHVVTVNGKTFAMFLGERPQKIYELPSDGSKARYVMDLNGFPGFYDFPSFGPDGSIRFFRKENGRQNVYQRDININGSTVTWGTERRIASAPLNATSPEFSVAADPTGVIYGISDSGLLAVYEPWRDNHPHLAAVKTFASGGTAGSDWAWKTFPAGKFNITLPDEKGINCYGDQQLVINNITYGIPNNQYEITSEYGGTRVNTLGNTFIAGYLGEFFRGYNSTVNVSGCGYQAPIQSHFHENGLMIGQFGKVSVTPVNRDIALPGFAGNAMAPAVAKASNGNWYMYINDESSWGGVHRWAIKNMNTISELRVSLDGSVVSDPTPTVTLTVDQSAVTSGGSTTLRWSSTNATSCTASNGWSGAKALSGTESTGALTTAKTYVLTCTGLGGSSAQQVTVGITPSNPDPQPTSKVEFYAGTTKIGEDSTAPYTFSWTNATQGSYALTARYSNSSGLTITSPAVNITVNDVVVEPSTGSCTQMGTISREVWTGITGTPVTAIPTNNPGTASTLTSFASPQNIGDNYGQRIRGYVCPTVTGNYTFHVAGDNESRLYLSPNDQASSKTQIAFVDGNNWTLPNEWARLSSQRSSPVRLEANKRYYIEVLHKETNGEDHVSVGWQTPNNQTITVIPGTSLAPWGSNPGNPPVELDPNKGDLQVVKVDHTYSLTNTPPTTFKVGSKTFTNNDETINNILGNQVIEVPQVDGYSIRTGVCTYKRGKSQCRINTSNLFPEVLPSQCSNGICKISTGVTKDVVTKTVVQYIPASPTITFNGPSSVNSGSQASLSWSVTNGPGATGVTATGLKCYARDGWSGTKTVPTGNESVLISTDTKLTLTCENQVTNDGRIAVAFASKTLNITAVGTSNTPPVVSKISSPMEGQSNIYEGIDISLNVTATDDGSVSSVEFFDNGTKVGNGTKGSNDVWAFTYNDVPAGWRVMTAVATDNQGAKTTTGEFPMSISDTKDVDPILTVTPSTGLVSPASMTLSVINNYPQNSIGITVQKMQFLLNGSPVGEDTSYPYTYNLTGVGAGTYTIGAKSYYTFGGISYDSVSNNVSITVAQGTPSSPNIEPTVSVSAPTGAQAAPANITLSATADDDDGTVTKVEFFNGTTKIGEDTTSPYSIVWASVPVGTYVITAKATDDDGATKTSSSASVSVVSSNPTFYKGINFGPGSKATAVTINGNQWMSYNDALSDGLTFSTAPRLVDTNITPSPSVDSATASMFNTEIVWSGSNTINITAENGTYDVYLWVMENFNQIRKFSAKFEGSSSQQIQNGDLAFGQWKKYGPYRINVNDGKATIEFTPQTLEAHVMGIELFKVPVSNTASVINARFDSKYTTIATLTALLGLGLVSLWLFRSAKQ